MRNAFVSPILPLLPDAVISNYWKKKAVHTRNKNVQLLRPILKHIVQIRILPSVAPLSSVIKSRQKGLTSHSDEPLCA